MKWVTWENVGVDRMACAWLIRKQIDLKAKFLFVPMGSQPLPTGAEPFDIPGVRLSHHQGHCSFHALLHEYNLDDPVLHRIARIVDEADTVRGDKRGVGTAAAESSARWPTQAASGVRVWRGSLPTRPCRLTHIPIVSSSSLTQVDSGIRSPIHSRPFWRNLPNRTRGFRNNMGSNCSPRPCARTITAAVSPFLNRFKCSKSSSRTCGFSSNVLAVRVRKRLLSTERRIPATSRKSHTWLTATRAHDH